MEDINPRKTFILAGKAIFTIKNEDTGCRFTYKVTLAKDCEPGKRIWFVSLLSGPDNISDYSYMGIIREVADFKFNTTAKTRIGEDAKSMLAWRWFWDIVRHDHILPHNVTFNHAGRCGRCGKLLTTPESILSGFGPICSNKI